MAEKFNPLKSWLGITTSEKPSYYDLIGLANFESEPPLIADAADSAIAKVSENLGGEHHAIAEKLVRDLKSLKSVLLSAEKRRAYDQQLAAKLGLQPPTPGPALPGMGAAIDAADSPTMMLPPGALSGLRSLDQVLGGAPPGAPPSAAPFGAPAGFPPGASPAPFGAPGMAPPGMMAPQGMAPLGMGGPPMGAPQFGGQPFGAQPGFADPQFGAPQQQPFGAPPGANPFQQPPFGVDPNAGFNPNPGFQQPGFGAPQQTMFSGQMPGQMQPGPMGFDPNQGGPFGGVPMGPGPMGGGPMGGGPMGPGPMNAGPMNVGPMNAGPMGGPQFGGPAPGGVNLGLGGPSAMPGGPTARPRPRPVAAKSHSSNLTVAFGVLGAAAVVLVIVILVVQKNKGNNELAAIPPKPAKVRDTMNPPLPPPTPANVAPLRNPLDIVQSSPASFPNRATRAGNDVPVTIDISKEMDPRERSGRAMDTNRLVEMMGGGTPIPRSSGTGPNATPSATAAAKPPATEMEAPKSPDGLKGVVVPQVAMEATLPEDAKRASSVATMLKGARASLKARDYAKAEESILVAQISADTPALIKRAQEHQRAVDLLRSFWDSARAGIKKLKAGDELPVSGKTATFVKSDDATITVKLDGKDIPLSIDKMPAPLAMMMAERSLEKDAPGSKLVLGTFLTIEGTDASRGLAMIESAAGGEIIVEDFLAMLKSTE